MTDYKKGLVETMKVLVINAGSSSLKYQFIDMETEAVLAKGLCERIGIGGCITHKANGQVIVKEIDFPTHKEAFEAVVECLTQGEGAVISDVKEISAIGHRVVQGGEAYSESTLITEDVLKAAIDYSEIAPLHNPPIVTAIKACQEVFSKDVPMVAVFDTSFHQTMPEKAYMYGIPYEYYEKYHVRKYGYHGTSHKFVSERLAAILGKDIKDLKIVTCHLGNGSSITAIDGGKSVDTSMGFTPLDGILMGTRSGAVDPSVITYLGEKENLTPAQMSDILNKKSGFLGVSGISSDNRDLCAAAGDNKRAALALDMQQYQIKKLIGSYAAAMGGLDAVIFTGGIGENSFECRSAVCENMEFFGIKIDEQKNKELSGTEANISAEGSKVQVWIVPTNEELAIARDTKRIVEAL